MFAYCLCLDKFIFYSLQIEPKTIYIVKLSKTCIETMQIKNINRSFEFNASDWSRLEIVVIRVVLIGPCDE